MDKPDNLSPLVSFHYSIIPVIQRLEQSYVIDQGTDLSIPCVASGSPYPTIKWTKVGEAMPTNVQQTDNVLRILNANPKNRGVYICLAENSFGGDTASTSIDVERKYNLWEISQ